MIVCHPTQAARDAAAVGQRPATAVIFDAPDARLVVFRLASGQSVPPHRNASSVFLTVLEGTGIISGADGERECSVGDTIAFSPNETHGMRAVDTPLHLLAVITPRSGDRPRLGQP